MEYPRLVSIETTNRCNAKCSFCPNNALARDRQAMDDDLFEKIISDCRQFPLGAIEPFLQGEPFVDPKIFERLESINRNLPDTALRLYSNGSLLNKTRTDKLHDLKIDKLFISLNTIDSERYDRIMGIPFDRTMDNLRNLTSPNNRGKVAKSIVVRLTVTDETTNNEKAEFKKLCKSLGVKPMIVGLFNYKGDIHSDLPAPNYPCEHITRLDIMVDGETTLCCMDQNGEYGWGSVKNNSVLEVFNNEKAGHTRTMLRTGKRYKYHPCDNCNLFWPSLSHMPIFRTIKFTAQYLGYLARYRPTY